MYVFDWDRFVTNPYTFEELVLDTKFVKLNVQDQVKNYGYVIEKSSIEFWQALPFEVKRQIQPKKDDVTIPIFCENVVEYLKGKQIKYWWSRSNTFDPVILYRTFNDANMTTQLNELLKYWTVRDTRTYYDAKFDFKIKHNGFVPIDDADLWNKTFEKHNSIHDVAAEVLRLQKIVRIENGCES